MSRQCRRPSPAPPSSRTIHYCIVSLTFLLNYAVVILVSARIPPLPSHHCVNSNQQLNEMHICTNLGLIKRKSREKEIDVTDRLGSLYSSRIIHPTSRVVFRWRAWERNGCKRGFGQPVTSQFENKIGPCKFTTHGQYENIAYGSRKLAEKPPMPIVIAAAAAAGRGPGPEARPSWHHSRNYHHWPTALAFASQLLRVSLSLSLPCLAPHARASHYGSKLQLLPNRASFLDRPKPTTRAMPQLAVEQAASRPLLCVCVVERPASSSTSTLHFSQHHDDSDSFCLLVEKKMISTRRSLKATMPTPTPNTDSTKSN